MKAINRFIKLLFVFKKRFVPANAVNRQSYLLRIEWNPYQQNWCSSNFLKTGTRVYLPTTEM